MPFMLAINFDNEIVLTNVYEGFNNYFIIYFPDVYLPTYLLYLFKFEVVLFLFL